MDKQPPRVSSRRPDLSGVPLEKLVAFAREEQLVDDVRIEGEQVVIRQGNDVFRVPRRLAGTFLVGMLRGRSWYLDEELAPAEEAGDVTGEKTVDVEAGPPSEAGSKSETAPQKEEQKEEEPPDDIETIGITRTLDALLAFTIDEGIILSFEKHPDRREVLVEIPACEASLSYVDAVNFLFDCVQDHLQAGRSG